MKKIFTSQLNFKYEHFYHGTHTQSQFCKNTKRKESNTAIPRGSVHQRGKPWRHATWDRCRRGPQVKLPVPDKPSLCPARRPMLVHDPQLPLNAAVDHQAVDTIVTRGSLPCTQAVLRTLKTTLETVDT